MTIRTNTRTWRNNASYFVQVGFRGTKGHQHIYAELKAITIDGTSRFALWEELNKYLINDQLIVIKGAKTAQKAIEQAVAEFIAKH